MKSVLSNHRFFVPVIFVTLVILSVTNCQKEQVTPDNMEIPDSTSVFNLDKGGLGLVIDTREIFKKGYYPATAQVSFQDYSQYDASLDIDQLTCIAIFKLENKDLSEEEKSSFSSGVDVTIEILDGSGTSLTVYTGGQIELNDSNFPLSLTTELPLVKRPLVMNENIPYLLQVEDSASLIMTLGQEDLFGLYHYEMYNSELQFYFVPSGDENTYMIDHLGYEAGSHLYYISEYDYFAFGGGSVALPPEGPSKFILEQDDDGWIKIRLAGTDKYLYFEEPLLRAGDPDKVDRFRIISDDIDWSVEDRGTKYNQPIMPPVKLDFAYSATLKNCSSAALSEEVGKTDSRTRTTTVGTMESLQLFSSQSITVGMKVGVEVGASVGADIEGIGEASVERKYSAEVSAEYNYTTSETNTTENTFSESTSVTSEVSRVRTLELQPYTALNVYDAIKSVDNVITPFIQILRITGTYRSTGKELTGQELVTEMAFNLMGGVISDIQSNYIEITIRGQATMDEIFDASTEVHEIEGGCGG
ncbi:MAG: ETX/MTX2 family pore-forming toxin [Bacteroidales bacterium]